MTQKFLWDFDIHTDHLISARRPDFIIINNKKGNLQNFGLCCLSWPTIKLKENEKKDKYFDPAMELEKKYGTWRGQLYQL